MLSVAAILIVIAAFPHQGRVDHLLFTSQSSSVHDEGWRHTTEQMGKLYFDSSFLFCFVEDWRVTERLSFWSVISFLFRICSSRLLINDQEEYCKRSKEKEDCSIWEMRDGMNHARY